MRVRRVSSQSTNSAAANSRSTRCVTSSRLPIGVAQIASGTESVQLAGQGRAQQVAVALVGDSLGAEGEQERPADGGNLRDGEVDLRRELADGRLERLPEPFSVGEHTANQRNREPPFQAEPLDRRPDLGGEVVRGGLEERGGDLVARGCRLLDLLREGGDLPF